MQTDIAAKAPDKLVTGRVVVARSRGFGVATGVILFDGQAPTVAAPKASGPKLSFANYGKKKEEPLAKGKPMKGIVRALLVQPGATSAMQVTGPPNRRCA